MKVNKESNLNFAMKIYMKCYSCNTNMCRPSLDARVRGCVRARRQVGHSLESMHVKHHAVTPFFGSGGEKPAE